MAKTGLGPKGHDVLQRAASQWSNLEKSRNPAALTISGVYESGSLRESEDVNDVDWYIFDSSRVVEAAYDKDKQRLYVKFYKPAPAGTPWTYDGVPANVWLNFKRSQSPGRFVNRVLNDFDYHRGNW